MMTIKGFPFNVDHDTNYVTYAGNLGGVPENWHVEYCKGEVQPRTPEDLDLQPGWDASYFFFPKQDCTNDGYVVDGLTANYTAVEPELNWANTAAWSSGTHAGASFPTSNYQSKFSGQLRVIRGGQYMFSTNSDDGSRLSIDGNVIVDNWGQHGCRRREHLIDLDEGWHNILAEHFNCGAPNSSLNVSYRGDDTDDIEVTLKEHIYHGKTAPVTVNPPETNHSAQSNAGGNTVTNIRVNAIGGASPVPIIAPFLEGPAGGSGMP